MLKTLLSFAITRYLLTALVSLLMGAAAHWYLAAPKVLTITQRITGPTVEVQKYITIHDIKEVIKKVPVENRTEIERLMKENVRLQLEVSSITTGAAFLTVKNQGLLTDVDQLKTEINRLAGATKEFKDWRIHIQTSPTEVRYDLKQKFIITGSSGRDAAGNPSTTLQLAEVTPKGNVPVEVKPVIDIQMKVDETKQHWQFGLAMQAGVGLTVPSRSPFTRVPGGVVGVQWLSRGRTHAAEDKTVAFATPVISLSEMTREIGVMPVSWNTHKIMPIFQDLWVSPYVGFTNLAKGKPRIGAFVTSTF